MKKLLVLLSIVAALITTSAEARHRHHVAKVKATECAFFCVPNARGQRVADHMGFGSAKMVPLFAPTPVAAPVRYFKPKKRPHVVSNFGAPTPNVAYTVQHILPHPEGCPHTAFCGCGAALEAFGHNVRSLWVAANWFQFPRAAPAPGMAIVRRHHVAILKEHVQGSVWMVIDHNGGRHQSWLHARSIAGYTVVNPHGGKYAGAY